MNAERDFDLAPFAHRIAAAGSVAERDEELQRLDARVRDIAATGRLDEVQDASIDALMPLLDDSYTAVSVCWTLTQFGPRARKAIPAIEARIAEIDAAERALPVSPEVDPKPILRDCVRRIRDNDPPRR